MMWIDFHGCMVQFLTCLEGEMLACWLMNGEFFQLRCCFFKHFSIFPTNNPKSSPQWVSGCWFCTHRTFFSPLSLPLEINKHQLLSRRGNHHTANSKFRRTPDWSTSLSIRIITTTFIRAATSHIIFCEHTVDSEQFWQQWLFLPEGHHKHQDCNALRCPMSITAQWRELFYHAWNVLHTNGWSYFTFHWNYDENTTWKPAKVQLHELRLSFWLSHQ